MGQGQGRMTVMVDCRRLFDLLPVVMLRRRIACKRSPFINAPGIGLMRSSISPYRQPAVTGCRFYSAFISICPAGHRAGYCVYQLHCRPVSRSFNVPAGCRFVLKVQYRWPLDLTGQSSGRAGLTVFRKPMFSLAQAGACTPIAVWRMIYERLSKQLHPSRELPVGSPPSLT